MDDAASIKDRIARLSQREGARRVYGATQHAWQIAPPWSLEALAQHAALSRSAFAERFNEFVGHPPMQYLANWRMQLATNYLRNGSESIAAVANRVGYDSEAAFSRAFKKSVGAPPSEWRAASRANSASSSARRRARTCTPRSKSRRRRRAASS